MAFNFLLSWLENFFEYAYASLCGDRDSSEFKGYVIAVIFLKRFNDQLTLECVGRKGKPEKLRVERNVLEERLEREDEYKFFILQRACWERIKQQKQEVSEPVEAFGDSIVAKKLILALMGAHYATGEKCPAQYSRTLRLSLENFWEKYHQCLLSILKERDAASIELGRSFEGVGV
jgi:hypothetical protein